MGCVCVNTIFWLFCGRCSVTVFNFRLRCSDEQTSVWCWCYSDFNVHSSHLSSKHPLHENHRKDELRGKKKTTTKETANIMNSWRFFSTYLSFLHHISAVSLTGHHSFFHIASNMLILMAEQYVKCLPTYQKNPTIIIALLRLTRHLQTSLWIIHWRNAIWTMQLECTLLLIPSW